MDVRFLNTFIEVAETRHFGKAAENLYLTQSAVSARIKQLEEYFNTPLFIRHRHSIKLTNAGEKLLPHAKKIAASLQEARKELSESDVKHLVLASTPNAWELSLQSGLMLIRASFADLSVRAEILSYEQLSRQLHERLVDIAFCVEPLKSDDVTNDLLTETDLVLYTNLDAELEQALLQYVHVDWGLKTSEALEKQYPQIKKAMLRTGSANVGLEYVLKHGGIIALPRSMGDMLVTEGVLFEVVSLAPLKVRSYLTYLTDAKQRGLSEIIDFLKQDKQITES